MIVSVFGADIYFLSDPSLSPDGNSVVFSYEGDLWMVPAEGGVAARLTGMDGAESHPRFSPDGQWIAFTGRQDGNPNVYILSLTGGGIQQLTFHDGLDQVDSWSWDSRFVYFTSNRYNNFSEFKVSIDGGTPVRLFENYFNTPHGVAEHPRTGALLFTDTWESFRYAHRKRYKGEYNPDIKSYNPQTGVYTVLTSYRGKDFWPAIDRIGTIYFVSDEANGEYNLYTFINQKKTQLTDFDSSIYNPQVSADGKKVVFVKDYQLFIYDVPSGKSRKIRVNAYQNDTLTLDQAFKVAGKISYFAVSQDGKKMAFVSRGELFVSDIKGMFIQQLQTHSEGRVKEVKWLEDNLTLVFNQTVDGWLNWFRITADGKTTEIQLTNNKQNNRNLTFNSRLTKGVYLSGRDQVRLMDLKTWKSETIVTDELWGFYNANPYFSPDDQYIVFTAARNFERDIFLHHLETAKTVNITNTGVTESDPFWSPDGKYLYFASDRVRPSYPRSDTRPHIYRLPLEKIDRDFKSTEFDKLFQKKDKEPADTDSKDSEETPDKKGKTSETPKKPTIEIKINWADMLERLERISPNKGSQRQPLVFQKEESQTVLYVSNHDGQKNNLWKTVITPFKPRETKKIKGAELNYLVLSGIKKKHFVLVKGNVHELDLKANKITKIKTDFTFRRNLRAEFNQMFDEVWASVQENFYDEQFHGADWDAVGKRYRTYLPHVNTRGNLRRLINDMLGELNSSHMGFYSNGDEEKTFYTMKSLQHGIRFDPDRPYVVRNVVKNSPADRKGKDVQPGDILLAVDGQVVKPEQNREFCFLRPSSDSELLLTFRRGEETHCVRIHPETSRRFRGQLYDEWIEDNQKYVDEKSSERIAYVYMKDMGQQSLQKFLQEMTSEWHRRDALILDLRYNTGGNVHDDVLRFLIQKPYTQWKYRGGKMAPQPNFAPAAKPIVLLINEQSLSDAEMTAAGFKALGLGKIIGTESYRWLIFTSGTRLVDGSFCRLPSWGCFTLDGRDIEIDGVIPDIYVKTTFKDRLDDRDPQLDKAIEEIFKELK